MKMSLVVALVSDEKTTDVIDAARAGGATGDTIISGVRGEGLQPEKTFLGLDLTSQRNMVLFLVAEQRARDILERIAEAGGMDREHGDGVAFQITIEDAVGLSTQLPKLKEELEDTL